MTRRTSAAAYAAIHASGALSRRRMEVYDALYAHGPFTASEGILWVPGMRKNDLSSRLSELVSLEVAYEVQERRCNVTGHMVIEFDVTERLPIPIKNWRKKSRLALALERVAQLEAENELLRKELGRILPKRTPV